MFKRKRLNDNYRKNQYFNQSTRVACSCEEDCEKTEAIAQEEVIFCTKNRPETQLQCSNKLYINYSQSYIALPTMPLIIQKDFVSRISNMVRNLRYTVACQQKR